MIPGIGYAASSARALPPRRGTQGGYAFARGWAELLALRHGGPVVAHGGISLEELIVPLVQVERWRGAAGGGGASGGEQ
jgi:hypothetical protein